MEHENLELPVIYKGQELLLPLRVVRKGYTHNIVITINTLDISFEPDEEGQYRAIVNENDMVTYKIDATLLQEVAHTIKRAVDE